MVNRLDRFLAGVLALFLACALLWGCGDGSGDPSDDAAAGDGPTELVFWLSAPTHKDAYAAALTRFYEQHPDVRVVLQQQPDDALTERLRAALRSGKNLPDLVELEISSAGGFLAGAVERVPFVDLRPRLERAGLLERLPEARLAPYTRGGRVFGLPHDVHPVLLAYRADLFAELGIEPESLDTWEQFVEVGRRVSEPGKRWMIEMSLADFEIFEIFLFQRGGNYFDAQGELMMDSQIAAETMAWYIRQIAGPDAIGYSPAATSAEWPLLGAAIAEGRILSLTCADWATKIIVEKYAADAAGKMKLMPLPAFEPGGRRTSTRGGTMLALPAAGAHHDLAWELATFLYFNDEIAEANFRKTNILPPDRSAWDLAVLSEPQAFWSGQPVGELFASVADDVPAQHGSPHISKAKEEMGGVVVRCREYYNRHGEEGFEAYVREQLGVAADEVRRAIKWGR